jgi:protein subunit release factor B
LTRLFEFWKKKKHLKKKQGAAYDQALEKKQAEFKSTLNRPEDKAHHVIQINSGDGQTQRQDFGQEMLARMYGMYAGEARLDGV